MANKTAEEVAAETGRDTAKVATTKPQVPDTAKVAVKENTTSTDPTSTETATAPNTNKKSDAAQGNEGTEDVNASGINQKSTPGMDSDASSSTSLGTVTGAPSSNETIAEAAARTNKADPVPDSATINNSPDANHSFRSLNDGGNDYYKPGSENVGAGSATDADAEKHARRVAASENVQKMAEMITAGTPDDHVLFGFGGLKFTVGDLKTLTLRD